MRKRMPAAAAMFALISVALVKDGSAARLNYPGQMCQPDAGHHASSQYNRYSVFNQAVLSPVFKFFCPMPSTGSDSVNYTVSVWSNTRIQYWDRNPTANLTCVTNTFFTSDVMIVGGSWSSSGGTPGSGPQESSILSHGLSLPASTVMQSNIECSVPPSADGTLSTMSGIGAVYVDMSRF